MYQEELITKVLSKSMDDLQNIDIDKLREILTEVVYNYEVQPISQALVVLNNVNDRIQLYIVSKKISGMANSTLKEYYRHLTYFSSRIQKNIEDIDSMDIRMYMANLTRSKQLKQSSLSNEISVLKSFFRWLHKQEYINKNPMDKIENVKVEKRLRKPLTPEQLELLKDACTTLRERALVECFYATGCRLSEIVNIKIGDIKWDKYSLTVIGKGNKERTVYFSPSSKIHIQKYLGSRNDITDESPLFISSKYPFGKLGGRAIEVEFHKIQAKAGISDSVFPHKIRTTTASDMISKNISISSIQKIYGHESILTTTRYAQITDDTAQQEYNKYFSH